MYSKIHLWFYRLTAYPHKCFLYFLKLSRQYDFGDYWTILVCCLWAEQCVINIWVIFQKMNKSVSTLIWGVHGGPCKYTFEMFRVKSASYSTWITRNNYCFDKKINSETVWRMLCQMDLNFILCNHQGSAPSPTPLPI